jgi:hypothetical protein
VRSGKLDDQLFRLHLDTRNMLLEKARVNQSALTARGVPEPT